MAYKVGSTIVISDSGTVDWSRIANKPAIGAGDITGVSVSNPSPAGGQDFGNLMYSPSTACAANCYIESLSGGGTSGNVTITANRRYFNCNCACRC